MRAIPASEVSSHGNAAIPTSEASAHNSADHPGIHIERAQMASKDPWHRRSSTHFAVFWHAVARMGDLARFFSCANP